MSEVITASITGCWCSDNNLSGNMTQRALLRSILLVEDSTNVVLKRAFENGEEKELLSGDGCLYGWF